MLTYGETHRKNGLTRFSTSILGTWIFWWNKGETLFFREASFLKMPRLVPVKPVDPRFETKKPPGNFAPTRAICLGRVWYSTSGVKGALEDVGDGFVFGTTLSPIIMEVKMAVYEGRLLLEGPNFFTSMTMGARVLNYYELLILGWSS